MSIRNTGLSHALRNWILFQIEIFLLMSVHDFLFIVECSYAKILCNMREYKSVFWDLDKVGWLSQRYILHCGTMITRKIHQIPLTLLWQSRSRTHAVIHPWCSYLCDERCTRSSGRQQVFSVPGLCPFQVGISCSVLLRFTYMSAASLLLWVWNNFYCILRALGGTASCLLLCLFPPATHTEVLIPIALEGRSLFMLIYLDFVKIKELLIYFVVFWVPLLSIHSGGREVNS